MAELAAFSGNGQTGARGNADDLQGYERCVYEYYRDPEDYCSCFYCGEPGEVCETDEEIAARIGLTILNFKRIRQGLAATGLLHECSNGTFQTA